LHSFPVVRSANPELIPESWGSGRTFSQRPPPPRVHREEQHDHKLDFYQHVLRTKPFGRGSKLILDLSK
ncbi:hypothetical protein KUCAC02_011022, partial [Chaenocephalus aceratus]